MSLIETFAKIKEESAALAHDEESGSFVCTEEIGSQGCGKIENILAHGDNLKFMKYLLKKENIKGRINLIYIDPPFFSKSTYDAVINLNSPEGGKLPPIKYFAYDDKWKGDMGEYLKMLSARLLVMKDLLAEDGTIWVHLDWHVVHYVKVILDDIFGEGNFVNEIIWHYKSGGSGKRHFARKHDTILVYSKGKDYYFSPPKEKSYNREYKPYRFKGVKEYKDEKGWYTMVTMKDVWNVDMVGRTSRERTGYATQKPEALVERIVEGASRPGDICADFYCGSGTLAAVAQKKGRHWICCDESPLAVSAVSKRMQNADGLIHVFEERDGSWGSSKDELPKQKSEPKFSVSREHVEGTDKDVVQVSLLGLESCKIPKTLRSKDTIPVKAAAEADSMQLVEYWSVDFDFGGGEAVYRPEQVFAKEKVGMETCCRKLIPAGFTGRLKIKAVDVFGGVYCSEREY